MKKEILVWDSVDRLDITIVIQRLFKLSTDDTHVTYVPHTSERSEKSVSE